MDFLVLIKNNYLSLTKSQKVIAEYLINNLEEAVFMTAIQIGKKLNISETSVIRFAIALGYDNYSSMTYAMQRSFIKKVRSMNEDDCIKECRSTSFTEYLKSNILGKKAEYSLIDFDEFKKIADLIMSSSKVLIIGYMDSFGISSELLHMLDMRRDKVYFYRLLFEERNILYNMNEDSLLITLSLSPHYRYSYLHTKTAREGGCKVISITDKIVNPYIELSDHSIVFNIDKESEDGLKDTSSITKFIYYLGRYINEYYKDEVETYRNSSEWREEEFID